MKRTSIWLLSALLFAACHERTGNGGGYSGNQGTDTATAQGGLQAQPGTQSSTTNPNQTPRNSSTVIQQPATPTTGQGSSYTTTPSTAPQVSSQTPMTAPTARPANPNGAPRGNAAAPINSTPSIRSTNSSINTPQAQSGSTRGAGNPGVAAGRGGSAGGSGNAGNSGSGSGSSGHNP